MYRQRLAIVVTPMQGVPLGPRCRVRLSAGAVVRSQVAVNHGRVMAGAVSVGVNVFSGKEGEARETEDRPERA